MGTVTPIFTRLKSRPRRSAAVRSASPRSSALAALLARLIPDAWCDPSVEIGHCAWCATAVAYGNRAHDGEKLVHYSCFRKQLRIDQWTAVRCAMFETLVPLIDTHPHLQVASTLRPLHADDATPAKAALVLSNLRLELGSNANSVIIADAKRQLRAYLAA